MKKLNYKKKSAIHSNAQEIKTYNGTKKIDFTEIYL
jgi:hypothetical protein